MKSRFRLIEPFSKKSHLIKQDLYFQYYLLIRKEIIIIVICKGFSLETGEADCDGAACVGSEALSNTFSTLHPVIELKYFVSP
jgi:hypothetical protein